MERTTAELRRLHAEGECNVVVLDYLEKATPSQRQLKMFGTNLYQREADNVEQLKKLFRDYRNPHDYDRADEQGREIKINGQARSHRDARGG